MLRSADDEELELLVGTIIGSWGDVSDSNSEEEEEITSDVAISIELVVGVVDIFSASKV